MNDYELERRINRTLACPLLTPELVVGACDELSSRIRSGCFDEVIRQMGLETVITKKKTEEAARILSRSFLLDKLTTELGPDLFNPKRYPLGVLLHIGAGNMDGLSAYSVVEGLLAGNINLLKLPGEERGISRLLLRELVRIEPELRDYVYIYDIPSANKRELKKLADLSDAVVVWGGDEAVRAVRQLAEPSVKLIEWGHKISFAYVTEAGMREDELAGLACHMVETGQLLCSSCQGIYLDTEDQEEAQAFCERFLGLLRQAAAAKRREAGETAKNTLRAYSAWLESACYTENDIYRSGGVSVILSGNPEPEASLFHGNCWVKLLPRERIIETLRKKKGYLQTVGLLCADEEREALSGLFGRAGAVRIRGGADMSETFKGEAHDGEYPLRRYSKIVCQRRF